MRRHITYANVISTLALFVVLGGGAYAVTGRTTANSVIHGCVGTHGALRIVSSSSACLKARGHGKRRVPGETAISWNQQGPPGAPGAQGSPGANGANGSARAYGWADAAGTLDTARSSPGVTAKRVATGAYCITPGVPGVTVTPPSSCPSPTRPTATGPRL